MAAVVNGWSTQRVSQYPINKSTTTCFAVLMLTALGLMIAGVLGMKRCFPAHLHISHHAAMRGYKAMVAVGSLLLFVDLLSQLVFCHESCCEKVERFSGEGGFEYLRLPSNELPVFYHHPSAHVVEMGNRLIVNGIEFGIHEGERTGTTGVERVDGALWNRTSGGDRQLLVSAAGEVHIGQLQALSAPRQI